MSNELKRIDPKAIPGMFEKHGMQPNQMGYYGLVDGQACCCVNTIIAAESVGIEQAVGIAQAAATYRDAPSLGCLGEFSRGYAIGLAEGWDNVWMGRAGHSVAEVAGYADGLAAWEACRSIRGEEAKSA